jgi:hypothetical protein
VIQYGPVRKRTVEIILEGTNIRAIDDGSGTLLGVGLSGTINYQTGDFTLSFTADPGAGKEILASYSSNFEVMTEIPTIGTEYDSVSVQSRAYALRSEIGLGNSVNILLGKLFIK